MLEPITAFFEATYGGRPALVTAAPGRVEFIGNHTDYNGGHVLGAAIDRHTVLALRPRRDGLLRLASTAYPAAVTLPHDALQPQSGPAAWANYVIGVVVMMGRHGLPLPGGFDLAVTGTLPAGAGLSSSAALELATALALQEAFDGSFTLPELVRLCHQAENAFVGVPCGMLDQAVCAFGRPDHLVRVDGATETATAVPIPAGVRLWIFNTHTRHALTESHYAQRHAECRAALRTLQRFAPELHHLAEAPPDLLDQHRAALGELRYARARHITGEHRRVAQTAAALAAGRLEVAGEHLLASHVSSRDGFENSTPELDFLVEALAATPHVYGARLTGGGFGGAVMAMTSPAFSAAQAAAVAARYTARFGTPPTVLPCRTVAGVHRLA